MEKSSIETRSNRDKSKPQKNAKNQEQIQQQVKEPERIKGRNEKNNEKNQAKMNQQTKHSKGIQREFYKCEKIVGQGAFGVVFKAKCLETNETVAVKKVLQDKKYKNRELDILQELTHPNIINIKHHFFSTNDDNDTEEYLNIVTEFYPDTLNKITTYFSKQKKNLPFFLTKLYTFQLLRGLAYLHAKNIAHRDIKPQNLLIDSDTQKLVICDFGSAKILQGSKKGDVSVAYISTRYYRAPELLLGYQRYGTEIDLWAAGCVLGEMLRGGKVLFAGDSNTDQLVKIIQAFGTPNSEQVHAMNPDYKEKNLVKIKPQDIKKLFPSTVPEEGLSLMIQLLQYDPRERLSAINALSHPFFNELRDYQTRLPNGEKLPDIFDLTIEEIQSTDKRHLHIIIPDWRRNQGISKKIKKATNL
eukprot:403359081